MTILEQRPSLTELTEGQADYDEIKLQKNKQNKHNNKLARTPLMLECALSIVWLHPFQMCYFMTSLSLPSSLTSMIQTDHRQLKSVISSTHFGVMRESYVKSRDGSTELFHVR